MAGHFAQLVGIEMDQEIRRDTHYEAWHHMEQGLLLALRASGTLNAMQYNLAVQGLKLQRSQRARRIREETE